MPPRRTRFITACQQMLALGVVLAALTPAASVVSLDVVGQVPGSSGTAAPHGPLAGGLAAYTRASQRTSVVPTQVIDPTVSEYSLTAPSVTGRPAGRPAGRTAVTRQARTRPGALPGSTTVVSRPQPVTGYGAVGVTWQHGVRVPDDEISLEVRMLDEGVWSDWTTMSYDDEHGPDPDSEEARHARPGTDELLVGEVEEVQVRATTASGEVPPDLKLAVIDPGRATRTAVEPAAIDTGGRDESPASEQPTPDVPTGDVPATDGTEPTPTSGDDLGLQAATYTPKPVIYSRAQWGADESMRDKSSLHYYEVHAGFVHHTVNANNYSRAEVPGIIRSIYAYHTQSKGWSDIGYNYVVDRFGRIWEGRYGGVDRPVVGAHTLGYNDYAFAMSAIGNYETAPPSAAMVQAYGALFAWKLALHGVDASSTRQWVGSKYFEAINGHRDAGQTACPGRYLYAKIPLIRKLAAEAQRGWAGRELESDLASTPHPDLVVRRASDGRAFVIPTGGLTRFARPRAVPVPWASTDTVVVSPDLTGDAKSDAVVRGADGSAVVYPGDGAGGFGTPIKKTDLFAGHDLVTAVGDLNGDGHNDLVARRVADGQLDLYPGGGGGGFGRRQLGTGWGGFNALAATGDLDGDGFADLLARDTDGSLWLYRGTGSAALGGRTQVPGSWSGYTAIAGFGDYTSDGLPDLFVRSAGGAGYLLPSRGDGTFGHAHGPLPRFGGAVPFGGGNLAGSAAADVLGRVGDQVVLYRNAGSFDAGTPIPTGLSLASADMLLNAGDWDRDGHGDIVTRSGTTGSLFLRRGDGAGHFAKAVRIGTGFGSVGLLAAVGDMTGDGWPDLMGQPSGGTMRIYPGNGLAGLRPSYAAHSRIDAGRQIPIGRWDADGAPDSLFRKSGRLMVFPGNGPGGLTDPRSLGLDLAPYDWVIGISDANLTGHPDLIVREKATGYLWLLRATATGFAPRWFLGEGMQAYDLAG